MESTHTLCKILIKKKKWCRVHDPNSNWNTNIAFYPERTVWGSEYNTVWVETDYLLEQSRQQKQSYQELKKKAESSSEPKHSLRTVDKRIDRLESESKPPALTEKQKAFKAKTDYWVKRLAELDRENEEKP